MKGGNPYNVLVHVFRGTDVQMFYQNYVFAKTTTNYMNNFNFGVQSIRIRIIYLGRSVGERRCIEMVISVTFFVSANNLDRIVENFIV